MDYLIRSKIVTINGITIRIQRRSFALLFRIHSLTLSIRDIQERDYYAEIDEKTQGLILSENDKSDLLTAKKQDIQNEKKGLLTELNKAFMEFIHEKDKRKVLKLTPSDRILLNNLILKFNSPKIEKSEIEKEEEEITLDKMEKAFDTALAEACTICHCPPWEAIRLNWVEFYHLRRGRNILRAGNIADMASAYSGNTEHVHSLLGTYHETLTRAELYEKMMMREVMNGR